MLYNSLYFDIQHDIFEKKNCLTLLKGQGQQVHSDRKMKRDTPKSKDALAHQSLDCYLN